MIINICFDLYGSIIECNIEQKEVETIKQKFEEWLYEVKEDDTGKYMGLRDSLNIEFIDTNVVIRFFKEIFPNSNPKIKVAKVDIDELDPNSYTIGL